MTIINKHFKLLSNTEEGHFEIEVACEHGHRIRGTATNIKRAGYVCPSCAELDYVKGLLDKPFNKVQRLDYVAHMMWNMYLQVQRPSVKELEDGFGATRAIRGRLTDYNIRMNARDIRVVAYAHGYTVDELVSSIENYEAEFDLAYVDYSNPDYCLANWDNLEVSEWD